MIFLIQTIDGKVVHDFSIKLLEAIKYHKWLDSTCDMQYVLSDTCILIPGFCPIGSVEFVQEYLTKVHLKSVKPINIPKSLLLNEYTNRNIFYGTDKDANLTLFTKSTNKIKGITGIYSSSELPYGNYMFSELGKRRIIASIDPRNESSIRLVERLKFRKEAHFKESILINGEWVDDLVYAVLKDEWLSLNY